MGQRFWRGMQRRVKGSPPCQAIRWAELLRRRALCPCISRNRWWFCQYSVRVSSSWESAGTVRARRSRKGRRKEKESRELRKLCQEAQALKESLWRMKEKKKERIKGEDERGYWLQQRPWGCTWAKKGPSSERNPRRTNEHFQFESRFSPRSPSLPWGYSAEIGYKEERRKKETNPRKNERIQLERKEVMKERKKTCKDHQKWLISQFRPAAFLIPNSNMLRLCWW